MVVVLRDVGEQHQPARLAEVAEEVAGHVVVGEVAVGAQDPLLHRPRVGAVAQHDRVVVRLDEDGVAVAEAVRQPAAHVAEVGGMGERAAVALHHEGERPRRVVGHRDAAHAQRPHGAGHAGLEHVVARDVFGSEAGGGVGAAAAAKPHAPLPGEAGRAARVVLMLVGDDDEGDGGRVHARRLEALGQLARAQAGVDEDPHASAFDEGGVAGAARPQDAESHRAGEMIADGGPAAGPLRCGAATPSAGSGRGCRARSSSSCP